MKPRRKIRALIKWSGAVVTVVLLVVWVGSAWCYFGIRSMAPGGGSVQLQYGCIEISWIKSLPFNPLNNSHIDCGTWNGGGGPHMIWKFYRFHEPPIIFRSVGIPLWPLIIAAGIGVFLMFRTDRRRARIAKLNLCPKCGYSRTGLPDDRACPECGSLVHSPPAHSSHS